MRPLGALPTDDGLSQLLLRMTVSSTVYCLSEMTAPWGFRVAARQSPAFHLLTSGTAWLTVEGETDGITLHGGDLVILPRGETHALRDSPQSRVLWLDDILATTTTLAGRLSHGGGGEPAELICGGFAIDQLTARPVLATLPGVIHLRGHEGRSPEWLSGLVRMISVEMATGAPGTQAVVTRLTDALLAQSLRAHLLARPAPASPVQDTLVARALRLMGERPDRRWSVPDLAGAVGLSRSAFAQRFRAATGEAPMQSLTRFRLAQAANYLRTTDAGLREIARRTGYESEVSISKAFRRMYGTPPGAYRRSTRPAAAGTPTPAESLTGRRLRERGASPQAATR